MCTVTYLPISENQFILTSNRDESPDRRAETWGKEITAWGETIHFPRDPLKGGTWFAISDRGRAACLLNGAFVPFKPDHRYTTSRGTVIPDFFKGNRKGSWAQEADFMTVAPFTLILFDGNRLTELIWDGYEKHIQILAKQKAQIWSSVTLYPPEVRQWRQKLFARWMEENPQFTQDKIMQFHRSGGKGDRKNGLVMNREDHVKTLSITSIQSAHEIAVLQYVNLDTNRHTTRHFQFHPTPCQS